MNLSTFLFLILYSVFKVDCNDLPSTFSSYREAETMINSASWKVKDRVDCSKSSWIQEASFYSCDGTDGYFIMKTKEGRSYLHKDVPRTLWNQFKGASSYGTFYNGYLKGKYQLVVG